MEQREISAKLPVKEGRNSEELTATILIDFPSTVAEAVDWCGEEALLSNAFANYRVTRQGNIRAGLEKGESQEALQARLGTAVMGVAVTGGRVDPQAAFIAKFKAATPEQQAAMLEELQAAAQG